MTPQHASLAAGQWETLSFVAQMANVGSEIERTIIWRNKARQEYAMNAFMRALELLDLTIKDARNRTRLRELTRTREALSDFFYFDNQYRTSESIWRNYFFAFTFAARRTR